MSLLENKYALGNPKEYYRNAYCNKIILALIVTYFLKAILTNTFDIPTHLFLINHNKTSIKNEVVTIFKQIF